MRIADGIEALDIQVQLPGGPGLIHPTALLDETAGERAVVLIDAGMPGSLPSFRTAMDAAGAPLARLGRVIVTHQDLDHIGGLPEILAAAPGPVEVLAHAAERPYIEGERRLLKLDPERMKGAMEGMPPERRAALERLLTHPPRAHVNRTLDDGEELPLLGGLRVVATPGHSPGHISLYHPGSRTLIAGDAVVVEGGRVQGPRPQVTPDMELAMASVARLAELDVRALVAYHGGVVTQGVNGQLRALATGRRPPA